MDGFIKSYDIALTPVAVIVAVVVAVQIIYTSQHSSTIL